MRGGKEPAGGAPALGLERGWKITTKDTKEHEG